MSDLEDESDLSDDSDQRHPGHPSEDSYNPHSDLENESLSSAGNEQENLTGNQSADNNETIHIPTVDGIELRPLGEESVTSHNAQQVSSINQQIDNWMDSTTSDHYDFEIKATSIVYVISTLVITSSFIVFCLYPPVGATFLKNCIASAIVLGIFIWCCCLNVQWKHIFRPLLFQRYRNERQPIPPHHRDLALALSFVLLAYNAFTLIEVVVCVASIVKSIINIW